MNWEDCKDYISQNFDGDFENENFLETIWQVSTEQLEGLEVSVIVDRDNKLFISKGTKSFVDYKDESVKGMKIPLKCWIHTHPFGSAYFSSTDWNTINTQLPIMDSAIVLGNLEQMKWWKKEGKQYLTKLCTIIMNESEE